MFKESSIGAFSTLQSSRAQDWSNAGSIVDYDALAEDKKRANCPTLTNTCWTTWRKDEFEDWGRLCNGATAAAAADLGFDNVSSNGLEHAFVSSE
jgi:hypothetical protein